MLYINIGYECGDRLHCDKHKQCKYKGSYKFHNLSVSLHRFFEYRWHIKLPHLLYIGKKWERLSGTDKCPFYKERYYSCYDCNYVGGDLLKECNCKERIETPYKERLQDVETKDWDKRCAYFEKCAWADDYK
jgi:hypothetical protein